MTPPQLSRRLTLEVPEHIPDGAGGRTISWAPLGVLWAAVTPRTGRLRGEGDAPVSTLAYRITVRGAPQGSAARPQPGQRFRDGGRIFHIRAVAEADTRARYLVCDAEEEVVA